MVEYFGSQKEMRNEDIESQSHNKEQQIWQGEEDVKPGKVAKGTETRLNIQ